MKILLAEDDPITRLLYSKTLRSCGYEVIAVEDGDVAWRRLQQEPVQILISDWEMPIMNGLELCRKVKSAPDLPYIYTILLTARDDVTSLIQGLDIGADDYLAKTCDIEVLKARVRSGGRILHLTAELEAKNQHLKEANERLDTTYSYIKRDLELAAKAQIGLLPPQNAVISGVRFHWLFLPSAFIGGDTLNYFRINESQVVFYQLDVAGHGVASALHSFSLTRILSPDFNIAGPAKHPHDEDSFFATPTSSADIAEELNRRFQSNTEMLTYFTMAYGILDMRRKSIDICLAGHQKPVYIPANGQPESIGSNGFPIGILPEADYKSTILDFTPGDRMFLYSDGITECANAEGEEFGLERLQALFLAAREEELGSVGKLVMSRLESWKGDTQFEDDISMLALEILAA
ncbi:MAG: PP2C family protein-serine/threonine phosphatase [Candidatus Methylumidiphilus sp.]